MAIFPFVGNSPKAMADCDVKVGGAWKQTTKVFEKVNGVWREAWSKETVLILDKSTATSIVHIVEVSGINSTSDKVTLENVRFVVRDDGYDMVTTYDKLVLPYNGYPVEYKTSSNAVGARVTITAKPTNTVEFSMGIQRNSVDRVEFSFSDIYKS